MMFYDTLLWQRKVIVIEFLTIGENIEVDGHFQFISYRFS